MNAAAVCIASIMTLLKCSWYSSNAKAVKSALLCIRVLFTFMNQYLTSLHKPTVSNTDTHVRDCLHRSTMRTRCYQYTSYFKVAEVSVLQGAVLHHIATCKGLLNSTGDTLYMSNQVRHRNSAGASQLKSYYICELVIHARLICYVIRWCSI
jgi:hypothetical protein